MGSVFSIQRLSGDAVFSSQIPSLLIYYPDPSDVRLGVQYGPTGAEYTGTMTGGTGPSAADIAAAVLAALNATTIPVNLKQVNNVVIAGSGVAGADPWRPA